MAILSSLAPIARATYEAKVQAPFQLAQVLGNIADQYRKERIRKLGEKFIEHGDYTPEGLKEFAEKNNVGLGEMVDLIKTVNLFHQWRNQVDPIVQVTETDPITGAKYIKYIRRSEAINQGRILTSLPEKVAYVNRRTGERKLFSKNEVPSSADWVLESTWGDILKAQAKPEKLKRVTVIDKLTGETKTVPEDQVGGRYEPFEVYKWRKEQEEKSKTDKQYLSVLRYLSGYLKEFVIPKYLKDIDPQVLALGGGIDIAVENMRKLAAQGNPQAKRDLALYERLQKMSAMLGLGEGYSKQEEEIANNTARALIEEALNQAKQKTPNQFDLSALTINPQDWIVEQLTNLMPLEEQPQRGDFVPPEEPRREFDLSALTVNPQGWIVEQLANLPDIAMSTLSALAQREGVGPAGEYVEGLSRKYGQGPGISFPLVSGLKGFWEWIKKRPENVPQYP